MNRSQMRLDPTRSIPGGPIVGGVARAMRGLRTGDPRSIYAGVALLVFGLWRRNRERDGRKLIYRKVLKPGEAIVIRPGLAEGDRMVITEDFAKAAKAKPKVRERR